MTWVNRRFGNPRAASTISAVLLGAILVAAAGTSTLGPAYGEMMDKNKAAVGAVSTSTSATMISVQGPAASVFRGQITSVQLDDGSPSWIQSGIWVMRILQSGDDTEPPRVQMVARFAMVMPDGNAMHSHSVYGFNMDSYTSEGASHTFEGTATVTMRDGPVSGVPVTVQIFNNAVLAMRIGPR